MCVGGVVYELRSYPGAEAEAEAEKATLPFLPYLPRYFRVRIPYLIVR